MFNWKRILVVISIILVLIVFQARNKNIDGPFKGLLGNIVNPIVYVVDYSITGIGNLWNSYINLINVQKENKEFKSVIDNLTLENNLLKEKVRHAERFSLLTRFYRPYDFERVPVNIVGGTKGYIKYLIIDKGSLDGVKKNDPVIGFQGLIGKVVNVYANTSEVDIILNISSNVSVINNRTRVVGILRGDGKGRLYVDYYDRLDNVRTGDVFVTSGLGQLFPKGIRVGRVSEIIKDKTGLFQKVYIEQLEDFYKLENAFIITNF